jgi:hypothetical protein
VLYSGSASATAWEQALNCAIFLNNSHRFKDDPEYGMILKRMRMGEDTVADRDRPCHMQFCLAGIMIVKLLVTGVLPDDDANISYACGTNNQRNGVLAGHLQQHILNTHPDVDSNEDPPDHT